MKKVRKILASPVVTVAAFALAVGLLLFSSVGGARAALTFFSETYTSDIEMSEIGVGLVENGNLATGTLLANMLPETDGVREALQLGKHYTEELKVRNTGSIDQYVRVNVYKYWKAPGVDNKEGKKQQDLSPDLIGLFLKGQKLEMTEAEGTMQMSAEAKAALSENGWLVDEAACTKERMVLYYSRPILAANGEMGTAAGESSLFTDKLAIDGSVAKVAEKTPVEGKPGTFRITYVYNDYEFYLDVKVDAVQDHNAADAILSAWGRKVSIAADGTLSLE